MALTYTYQWKDGSGNISGATSSTYTITSGEVLKSIHCAVTATGTGGSTSQDSNTVGPIGTSTGTLQGFLEFQSDLVIEWSTAGLSLVPVQPGSLTLTPRTPGPDVLLTAR